MFPTIHTNTRKKFDNSSNDIVGIMALVRLRKFFTFASWLKFCVQVLSMPYHIDKAGAGGIQFAYGGSSSC